MLKDSTNDDYSANMINPCSYLPLFEKVNLCWVQSFMKRFRIVSRAHAGKPCLSLTKENKLEISVAIHRRKLRKMLVKKAVDENNLGNADETHFLINMDNGRTLVYAESHDVKYSGVLSGGDGMTMVLQLSSGRDVRNETPFMVFMKKDRYYPIRRFPDTLDSVAYRTGPKDWLHQIVVPK